MYTVLSVAKVYKYFFNGARPSPNINAYLKTHVNTGNDEK